MPDETSIDYANRITVTVTDKDGNPLKDISVTVSDTAGNSQTDKTDENGKMVVPPLNEDITDENEKIKKRFLTNTKIIIQRSYRIIFDFKGDWNASKEDKENVICIIEYVYQNAGMDEQTIKEIELF